MPDTDTTVWVPPSVAAAILGVDVRTVTRWADLGRFGDLHRTPKNQRRLNLDAVKVYAEERAA